MEFEDVVRRRKMVRKYTSDPVDPAVVDRVLRNATRAPSAGFTQGWSFLVLDTPEDTARYWDIFVGDEEWEADGWLRGMRTAPVLVLPCASKAAYLSRYAEGDKGWTDEDEARWPMPYWYMDTAMAVMLMLQTVVDQELGACYFGVPPRHEAEVRTTFGIPDGWDPIGVVSIGHPAPTGGAKGSPTRRPRKPVEEIVHRGSW
ncbi:nitroreductase family protein [Nocardioides sp. CER19]|uniref:nitroreductase family protein n=1 Tax=Nocardioides sp. CER19 TaxID=3038538 RepID=UPI002447AA7E|nr:nitroreductase family protein [Nocardioides sp. CER19]MDH2413220.1 nitroreductase family protein [Nocardioides sp. CER19]